MTAEGQPHSRTAASSGVPVVLATLSGVAGLAYEVVWTREAALLAGSQVEAISAVLVAYFGGLALGARVLGARADRVRHPLALYGALEIGAGLLAVAAGAVAWSARERGLALGSDAALLALAAGLIAPATFLLGGTLPALVRGAARLPREAARTAGWIVGANTAGAVAGVVVAVASVPRLGLRATLLGAATASIGLGLVALGLAGRAPEREPAPAPGKASTAPAGLLLAAAVAGVATLAFEVLAARSAALRLGSSLYAWATVLALFLGGLAVGNAALARRAARSARPETDLGVVEAAAAVAIAGGAALLVPGLATPAQGATRAALLVTTACVFPPALLMGAAFPFFVRLGARESGALGAAFGAVSAANTGGGIAGALLAPFVLLEALGLRGAVLACAAINAVLAAVFLLRGAPSARAGAQRLAAALGLVALAWWLPRPAGPSDAARRVLFARDGRQASAVVVRAGDARELIVDGEPEASTGGSARRTEERLATLPLALHPAPRRFLEIGLGSGITLGSAAHFGLERIECVEIAASVIEAAPWFAPDNGHVATGADPRVHLVRGDGRAFLARSPAAWDVVAANTVHPWSLGATGLYSREYYARVARALRPGGIAAQWLPLERIGAAQLAAILRTFFQVFPEGGLWWGDENLIAIGALEPLGLDGAGVPPESAPGPGYASRAELRATRLADAAAVREALGPGPILSDDLPQLEARASRRGPGGGELALALEIARAGARADASRQPMALWLESRVARRAGDTSRANRLEQRAERAGLEPARRGRIDRIVRRQLDAAGGVDPEPVLRGVLEELPDHRDARFALARIALERGDLDGCRRELRRLLESRPDDAPAWNLLGVVEERRGRHADARRAFARALEADPYLHQALANAGLLAAAVGDYGTARELLARLRAASPTGPTPEERELGAALAGAPGA